MAMKERIIFQAYLAGRGAAIVSGHAVLCQSVEEARRRAEKAMSGGRAIGAHVIRVMDDAASGEYGEPSYVLAWGKVPVTA